MTLAPSNRRASALPAALALAVVLAAPDRAAAEDAPTPAAATVRVVSGPKGALLTVNGEPFLVKGVNWDYYPVGTNYTYSLWKQPDSVIEAALENELSLMRRMGVNAIRVGSDMPRRWIRHVYERYGIWTVLNHTVGRYGYDLDGAWIPNVDYSSPRFRAAVKAELAALVEQYKGTPGLLMWLLGNENNYGLSWSSFEIEALPQGEREAAKARYLYSLFGEIVRDVKARDPAHPVAIANGDVQYVDLIASECKGLDVFGTNVYRGRSARDLFDVVKEKLGVPVLFTEFGADAYDAKRNREDDLTQARYLLAQWREIYEQSAGHGKAGNAIGGLVFQWSDGWWKYKHSENLDVHDTNASWPNGGYAEDLVPGQNNMNEEWWGICAKGPPDGKGLYALQPRTAYWVLQRAFRLDPYAPGSTVESIDAYFGDIVPEELAFHYQAAKAAQTAETNGRVRLANLRLSFETYSTGGNARWQRLDVPNRGRGFDHTESMYVEAHVKPADNLVGKLAVNVLGNVALNPIDEIFYERRGQPVTFDGYGIDPTGQVVPVTRTVDLEPIKIYGASVAWDEPLFRLDGFYRTGHYHWAAEGDVFGLYREANYGASIDVYDADVPAGFELTGKQQLEGLKLAFGPALWWGANPALMGKYRAQLGPATTVTLLHQEDLAQARPTGGALTVIPERQGRKTELVLETRLLGLGVELAGLRAGASRVGSAFLDEKGRPDEVLFTDTFGARAKVTFERGLFHWYAQGAYMGLVADAAPDPRTTFTGWYLKDSGSGNQVNALSGFALGFGPFQLGPNFLWQKPLVGPGPSILPSEPGAARNIVSDVFAVRSNRETIGGELMLVYDPTPATWAFAWDNDLREDAPFMASLDVSFRHMPTGMDAKLFYAADGSTIYAFPAGVPAADVWEVNARVVSAPRPDLRVVLHAFAGNPQANGQDPRQPHRYGGDVRVGWGQLAFSGFAKFNDWGPYDYHRDFDLTFPLQLMGDLSYTLAPVRWLWQEQTRLGVRATSRWLNGYSPRYLPDSQDPRAWGHEYELRTYLVVTM